MQIEMNSSCCYGFVMSPTREHSQNTKENKSNFYVTLHGETLFISVPVVFCPLNAKMEV